MFFSVKKQKKVIYREKYSTYNQNPILAAVSFSLSSELTMILKVCTLGRDIWMLLYTTLSGEQYTNMCPILQACTSSTFPGPLT